VWEIPLDDTPWEALAARCPFVVIGGALTLALRASPATTPAADPAANAAVSAGSLPGPSSSSPAVDAPAEEEATPMQRDLRPGGPEALMRTYGPVIASGTEAGHPWSLRGRIDASGAATLLQTSTGGGGSAGGALPFEDLGWKKLGHFGGVSSGENHGIGAPRTLTLEGVVSKQTAAIDVRLADGSSLPAQIIDTGDARASFFVAVWSTPSRWEVLIARDAAGTELETYRRR
jgi:hypothetical protein